ncbi:MAG: formate dehydrogenase accessory sulfurtransferase FdhD, partial [Anaerolineae bacterium]
MPESQSPSLVTRSITAYRDGQLEIQQVAVVAEEPLIITVNGQQVAALMRLPGNERELAAGFLVSEGIIPDFGAIYTISHCGSDVDRYPAEAGKSETIWRNRVDVQVDPSQLNPEARLDILRLVRAGCGAVEVDLHALQRAPLTSTIMLQAEVLFTAAKGIREGQSIHTQAGGTHAAGVYSISGAPVVVREDIGRHNAVDKACGYCLLHFISLADKFLICSGRLSYEMVNKALNLGLSVIASRSAP